MQPDIATMARRIHQRMQALAARAIEQNRLRPAEASAKLLPWTAIAVRCGVPREELQQGQQLDHDLPTRSDWLPVLAEARDRALDRHYEDPTPDREQHARDLMLVARDLQFEIFATPLPPYRPSKPMASSKRETAA